MKSEQHERLLHEINRGLPENIDWKKGAVTYLEQLVASEGSGNEIYHLIKPFLGGPDFQPFFEEMYGFLNFMQKIDLPMKSKVLDVACGPGWTSHYMGKLGYDALGIDISPDLVEIAKKRVELDSISPYEEIPFKADFIVHDIEESPLETEELFKAAFFESALHHFYDPVSVIRNISQNLEPDGLLCIWEAVAPEPGSAHHDKQHELMTQYQTLERPYTRKQLTDILELCGFEHYEFYTQLNGFFNPENYNDMEMVKDKLAEIDRSNICIASRADTYFRKKGRIRISQGVPERANLFRLMWLALSIRDQREWLSLMYKIILGREADAAGLEHYMKRPGHFFGRMSTIRTLMNSPEYQQAKE